MSESEPILPATEEGFDHFAVIQHLHEEIGTQQIILIIQGCCLVILLGILAWQFSFDDPVFLLPGVTSSGSSTTSYFTLPSL